MSTLLEISEDLLAVCQLAEEAGLLASGELSPEAEKALDDWFAQLSEDWKSKVDSYAALIRERELRAASRQAEVERLEKLVKADMNFAARLKDRLKMFMDYRKERRVDTARFRVTVATNGGLQALELLIPEWDMPAEYKKTITEQVVDKDKLRADLQAGKQEAAAVCRLKPRGTQLKIA